MTHRTRIWSGCSLWTGCWGRCVSVAGRSGGRSGQVVSYLMGNGWDNVRNLDGGMQAWAGDGRDVVSENGQPPRVL